MIDMLSCIVQGNDRESFTILFINTNILK